MKHHFPELLFHLFCATVITYLCSCVFDSDESPMLDMSIAGEPDDSVAALPRIICVFSSEMIDSTVRFSISPPRDFYRLSNSAHDTFTIVITELLPGNSRHVIRPADFAVSVDGRALSPEDDSIVFCTADYRLEQEPNDNPPTADTLDKSFCGALSTASDTDQYVCDPAGMKALYIISYQTRASFSVHDSTLAVLALSDPDKSSDVVAIESGSEGPLYIKVFAANRSSGVGYYELGILLQE